MGDEQGDDPPGSASVNGVTAFVAWLKKYKELITILLFFGAGGVWLISYFATKQQLDELKCLALKNVDLVNSDMRDRFAQNSILESSRRLDELARKERLRKITAVEIAESIRIKNQLDLQK